jgi:hypothetical protein
MSRSTSLARVAVNTTGGLNQPCPFFLSFASSSRRCRLSCPCRLVEYPNDRVSKSWAQRPRLGCWTQRVGSIIHRSQLLRSTRPLFLSCERAPRAHIHNIYDWCQKSCCCVFSGFPDVVIEPCATGSPGMSSMLCSRYPAVPDSRAGASGSKDRSLKTRKSTTRCKRKIHQLETIAKT